MAELTKEELQAQLVETKKALKASEAEKAQLTEQTVELKAAVDASEAAGNPSPLVPGKVKLKLETPDGKTVSKTVGFRNGRKNVRLPNGDIVPSALFLKFCNGTKLPEGEAYPVPLIALGQEDALQHLTNLVTMGASMIVEK